MKRTMIGLICLLPLLMPAEMSAASKRPIILEDFYKLKRVSDPQISPDGKWVAYVVAEVDMEANRIPSSIWLAATDGKSKSRRLTNAVGKKDRHPRWSPDSQRILFESNRSGDSQLWIIDVSGGEARQGTSLSTGANTGIWSPDGKHIAFVSAVWPKYSDKSFKESDALNKKRKEKMERNPVKARVFTRLFYRHWDEWVGRYELRALLGRGGMGTVYLAHDPQLDRLVALKIPRPMEDDPLVWRERFLAEARAATL